MPSSKSNSSQLFLDPEQRHTKHVKMWTLEEDELLKYYHEKCNGKWRVIEKFIPGRTKSQCVQRWRRIKPNTGRRKWTQEEDQELLRLISIYGKNWKLIESALQNQRNQKQIRERYINKLDPQISIKKWTPEEDNIIISWYYRIGAKWSDISKYLEGRPENMVKNRFYSQIKKKLDLADPFLRISNDATRNTKDHEYDSYRTSLQMTSVEENYQEDEIEKADQNKLIIKKEEIQIENQVNPQNSGSDKSNLSGVDEFLKEFGQKIEETNNPQAAEDHNCNNQPYYTPTPHHLQQRTPQYFQPQFQGQPISYIPNLPLVLQPQDFSSQFQTHDADYNGIPSSQQANGYMQLTESYVYQNVVPIQYIGEPHLNQFQGYNEYNYGMDPNQQPPIFSSQYSNIPPYSIISTNNCSEQPMNSTSIQGSSKTNQVANTKDFTESQPKQFNIEINTSFERQNSEILKDSMKNESDYKMNLSQSNKLSINSSLLLKSDQFDSSLKGVFQPIKPASFRSIEGSIHDGSDYFKRVSSDIVNGKPSGEVKMASFRKVESQFQQYADGTNQK